MRKVAPPLYGQSALLRNGHHGVLEKGPALGPAFDLVGGARGIRTAPRGTSRRRRLTEQVISPPALGESQRALTQGTLPGVPLRYTPGGGSAGPLSLIVSVARVEEHLARSGLSRHVTHPLPRRLLHPCVLRPAILKAYECPANGYKSSCFKGRPSRGSHFLCFTSRGLCTGMTLDGGIPCSPQSPWDL